MVSVMGGRAGPPPQYDDEAPNGSIEKPTSPLVAGSAMFAVSQSVAYGYVVSFVASNWMVSDES